MENYNEYKIPMDKQLYNPKKSFLSGEALYKAIEMNDDKQYTITINEADKDTSTWFSNTISIGDMTYAMSPASEPNYVRYN